MYIYCHTHQYMYNLQFHLSPHMHINAAIERDDGRSEKGDVRENMHMTNNLATSCKKGHTKSRKRNT